jgi:hypothetical protein
MMTPKEFLDSYVENFNTRNLDSLMDMYETEAHFAIKPGQVINGLKKYTLKPAGFHRHEW